MSNRASHHHRSTWASKSAAPSCSLASAPVTATWLRSSVSTSAPSSAPAGILEQIETAAHALAARHRLVGVGIGFGGPIDTARGVVTKSHHIDGWHGFPLVEWCQRELKLAATLQNDCDAAALAEARFGAGAIARRCCSSPSAPALAAGWSSVARSIAAADTAPPKSVTSAPACTPTVPIKRSNRWPAAGASPPPRKPG